MARVLEIWRYPVKSMVGESLSDTYVTRRGIPSDRRWCVYDKNAQTILSAKRMPALLTCSAQMRGHGAAASVNINLPDGTILSNIDANIDQRLSAFFNATVSLSDAPNVWNLSYYCRRKRLTPARMRFLLGVKPGQPLPDLSATPLSVLLTIALFETPPGTHYDAQPIHIVSALGLRKLEGEAGVDDAGNVRRFRPNIVIDKLHDDMNGASWIGRRLNIGDAVFRITGKTLRCSMPYAEQAGLGRSPELAVMLRDNYQQYFGLYAIVERPGNVSAGDPIAVIEQKTTFFGKRIETFKSVVRHKLLEHLLAADHGRASPD